MIKPKVTPPSAPDGEVTNRRSDVAHSARVNDKRAAVQEHGNHADNYEGKPDVVKCPWKYESRIVNIPPSIVRTMQANVRNLCGLNGEEVKIRTCLSVQGSKLRVLFLAAVPTSGAGSSFADFQWEERADVRLAQRWAMEEGSASVTEQHLLLGILETKSNTQQGLKDMLGEDDFRRLIQIVKDTPVEPLYSNGPTPWIRDLLQRDLLE